MSLAIETTPPTHTHTVTHALQSVKGYGVSFGIGGGISTTGAPVEFGNDILIEERVIYCDRCAGRHTNCGPTCSEVEGFVLETCKTLEQIRAVYATAMDLRNANGATQAVSGGLLCTIFGCTWNF